MKKFITLFLGIAIVVAIVFVGCAQPAAPTTPTEPTEPTTPTAPTTPTEPTEPTEPTTPAFPEPTANNPFSGLGVKPDGTPYYFAFSPCFAYNPWMVFTFGIFNSYVEKAGATGTIHDPNYDVAKQCADLEDLLVRAPDGILLHPIDGDAAAPFVDQLSDAGIPVFNFDNEAMSDNVVSFVTHDNNEMGRVIGEWTADYFDKAGTKGVIYTCQGALSMRITTERHQGFMDAIEGNENIELITGPDCGWADEPCANAVMDYVSAHPEVNTIFTHGGMLKGATEGLRSLDRLYPVGDPNHVLAVTIDANDQTCDLINDGWASAVTDHSPWEQVDLSIKAMFHSVCLGNEVPKRITLPCKVLDYDMISTDIQKEVPEIWGNIMLKEIPWDDLDPLDMSEYLETPMLK